MTTIQAHVLRGRSVTDVDSVLLKPDKGEAAVSADAMRQ